MRFRFGLFSLLLAIAAISFCFALYASSNREVVIHRTGRELDVAIVGRGYFQYNDPDSQQIQYTRRGRLYLTPDGTLAIGPRWDSPLIQPRMQLQPDYQRIVITPDGLVSMLCDRGHSMQQVGGLELALFPDDACLEPIGGDRYVSHEDDICITGQPGGPEGAGSLQQFWLEEVPASDAARASKLLLGLGCTLGLAGAYWVKRRFERLEAAVRCVTSLVAAADRPPRSAVVSLPDEP